MPEKHYEFRDQEFQERNHRLVDILIRGRPWKVHEHVNRHLQHGVLRRLQMIEHGTRVLAELPPDKSPALDLHQVQAANLALNGLYLNLRGILDNVAWAVTYHLSLLDSPNEADRKHRAFVLLSGQRFLTELTKRDPELGERLTALADWGRELAAVRDPAAHRIPLYIPPSVLDEKGLADVTRIEEELAAAAEAGDWDTLHSKMMDRWNAGPYRALVILSEQEGMRLVSLPGVLNRDLGNLLDSLELVVSFLFAQGVRPTMRASVRLPTRKYPAPG